MGFFRALGQKADVGNALQQCVTFHWPDRLMNLKAVTVSTEEPIVMVNIGWMTRYQGPDNDPTLGGHGYLKTHQFGHEAWNFEPINGRLYGYIPRSAQIDLRRLGGGGPKMDGVTVVWIARDPEKKRRTKVIGWYRGATIHKDKDHHRMTRGGIELEYQVDAPADRAVLLKTDQRHLEVPTAKIKGNMGQSPVWYGNEAFLADLRAHIAAASASSKLTKKPSKGKPRQSDPEKRKLIELAAVKHATDHYESADGGSRVVESVEKDNAGWDLTVTAGTEVLKVEVKGLSGSEVCVELTPNEYQAMRSAEHRAEYVVYVVAEAGTANAKPYVFYHHAERSKAEKGLIWQTRDGHTLNIKEIPAARLTIV
jgi:hypothetical protein